MCTYTCVEQECRDQACLALSVLQLRRREFLDLDVCLNICRSLLEDCEPAHALTVSEDAQHRQILFARCCLRLVLDDILPILLIRCIRLNQNQHRTHNGIAKCILPSNFAWAVMIIALTVAHSMYILKVVASIRRTTICNNL